MIRLLIATTTSKTLSYKTDYTVSLLSIEKPGQTMKLRIKGVF